MKRNLLIICGFALLVSCKQANHSLIGVWEFVDVTPYKANDTGNLKYQLTAVSLGMKSPDTLFLSTNNECRHSGLTGTYFIKQDLLIINADNRRDTFNYTTKNDSLYLNSRDSSFVLKLKKVN